MPVAGSRSSAVGVQRRGNLCRRRDTGHPHPSSLRAVVSAQGVVGVEPRIYADLADTSLDREALVRAIDQNIFLIRVHPCQSAVNLLLPPALLCATIAECQTAARPCASESSAPGSSAAITRASIATFKATRHRMSNSPESWIPTCRAHKPWPANSAPPRFGPA